MPSADRPRAAGLAAPRSGWRLQLVAVAVLLAATAAIAGISAHRYFSLERDLTEAALARRAALAALAAATLSERLDRVVDIGISLASQMQFRDLTAMGRWDDAAEILRSVPRDFQYISRASLFDRFGTFQSSVPDKLPFDGRNFAHRDWYKGVTADGAPFVSSAYVRESRPVQTVYGTAVPIKAADGAVLAILHLQTELKPFFNWLGGADFGAQGFAFVVDRAGQLVSHPRLPAFDSIVSFSGIPAVREALSGRSGTAVARDEKSGEELIYGYAPARHGWGVVTVQPSALTFAVRDAQLRTTVIDGALIALFALAAIALGITVLLQRRREDADRVHRAALERTHETLAKQAGRLRIVHEIDRAIIADATPEAISAAVIQPLRELLGAARTIVNLFDLEAGQVEWLAAAGRRRTHVGPGVRYSLALMGDLEGLKRGEPQIIDTRTLPPGAEVDALLASGIRVYMAVPMIAGGELIGALSFGGEQASFPAEQVTIAREVATQLAIAIAHARLFERVQRHAEELEARVRERTAQLETVNKELEAFSYSVSHDLRAPLRAVDGYAQMLEEDYTDVLDAEGRRLLGVVRAEAARMGRLIDDLLQFSQVGRRPIVRAPLDMRALASEVIVELAAAFPKARVVISGLPAANGDRPLLRQVWSNLIANALKYSARRDDPLIEVSGRADGTENVYWVRDNGAGFDMRYGEKLFKVFQRLHRQDEFEGTGVGLAIVQRVVARHGGRVWAEGAIGEGACFSFSLSREAGA